MNENVLENGELKAGVRRLPKNVLPALVDLYAVVCEVGIPDWRTTGRQHVVAAPTSERIRDGLESEQKLRQSLIVPCMVTH